MVQCFQCGWSTPKAPEIGGQSPTLHAVCDYVLDCGKNRLSFNLVRASFTYSLSKLQL